MPRTVSREDVQMHSSAEGCRANILILARKFLIGGGGGLQEGHVGPAHVAGLPPLSFLPGGHLCWLPTPQVLRDTKRLGGAVLPS